MEDVAPIILPLVAILVVWNLLSKALALGRNGRIMAVGIAIIGVLAGASVEKWLEPLGRLAGGP